MSSEDLFRVGPNRIPIRLLNVVWAGLQRRGYAKPSFSQDALVGAARKRSKLEDLGSDFDSPATQGALGRLLVSLEEEADLHPFGRAVVRGSLVSCLVTRLHLERLSQEHPEIPAMSVETPVFIAGLARTGTTLLHRLLGCEPSLRPLFSWEGLSPAPPATEVARSRRIDPRMRRADLAERALRYMAPAFFAIHPVEAAGYEEDVMLQDGSFMSPTLDAILSVPRYSAWLHCVDQRPMYDYFRRLVQLLLWQRPGLRPQRTQHYLGKTPHHLENLPALLEVFPDARVIVTHRDPAKVVPSFCSMMAHGRLLFSDNVNLRDIGRQVHAKQLKGVRDAMEARRSLPASSFIDVHYAELMADPMKEIRRIYDFLGLELAEETRAKMDRFRGTNPKDKRGVHRYRAEDFGLDPKRLGHDFVTYRDHYGIARESQ